MRNFMPNYHQISLKQTFSDSQEQFQNDTPSFSCLMNILIFLTSLRPLSETPLSAGRFSFGTYCTENPRSITTTTLMSTLTDFFSLHLSFHPDTFLGDSAFDSADIYGFLKEECHFAKALIPFNPRNEIHLPKVGYNTYGYPACPNAPSLTMRYCGVTKEKGTERLYLCKHGFPYVPGYPA